MDDTTAPAESGTEQTTIEFGGEATEEAGSSANLNSTENQAAESAPDETASEAPKARSLSELQVAFKEGEDISDEESDRILLAAKKGFKTDEEIDAYLAANPKKGAKREAAKGPAKPVQALLDKPAEKAKDKDVLDDPLARLVKEINPTKPEPEEAFKSLQSLKADYRRKGERLSTLDNYAKQVGFDSVEAVLDRAMAMEQRLEQMLKTPDGLKQLLKAYNVPETVLQGTAPAGAKVPELSELDDEEFPQGGKIKSVMQKMAQDIETRIRAELETKYGAVEKNFGEIQQRIQREEEYRRTDTLRHQAVRDAEEIAKLASEYDMPEWVLKDPAEKVFAESTYVTYKDGKKIYQAKRDPHPEWPALQKILEVRKEQYLTSGAPKVSQWFGEMLLERKSFQKIKTDAAKKATAQLLTKQRQALQPTLVNKGKAQVTETFKMPESEDDIDSLTPEQQKELRRRIFAGEVKVK